MRIEFDAIKRELNLAERGLDFARAKEIFKGPVLNWRDARFDYGEVRMITFGQLEARWVILVWTPRGKARRIISLRSANEREIKRYATAMARSR